LKLRKKAVELGKASSTRGARRQKKMQKLLEGQILQVINQRIKEKARIMNKKMEKVMECTYHTKSGKL